ncbi:MAG: FxLYD domain-containing protein [Candidatus Andersenbacteria bacterium]|nr:FxLYD domain-containing protein [Candidatus Andersenbacteria bacterium]
MALLPGSDDKALPTVEEQQKAIEKEFEGKIKLERRMGFLQGNARMMIMGLSVLVIVGLAGWGAYWFFTQAPEPVPVTPVGPPADFEVQVVSLQPIRNAVPLAETSTVVERYDVLARVRNTDPDWGLTELDYELVLLDAAGVTVGSRKGTTFLPPETEQGIVEFQIDTTDVAAQASISLEPVAFEQFDREIDILTGVEDVLHELEPDANGEQRSVVSGILRNASSFQLSTADLIVSAYNASGALVGLNGATVSGVPANGTSPFEVRWQERLQGVTRVEVEVLVNPFELENLLGNQ